jgi:hypothetical protein
MLPCVLVSTNVGSNKYCSFTWSNKCPVRTNVLFWSLVNLRIDQMLPYVLVRTNIGSNKCCSFYWVEQMLRSNKCRFLVIRQLKGRTNVSLCTG